MLKNILKSPIIYQSFQQVGGFFGARLKAISEFLTIEPGMRILDIGCGPGYMVRHLPKGIEYVGFDIDESYIEYANKTFGDRGQFMCRYFDAEVAKTLTPMDIVMMNGVLHHISDEECVSTLKNIRAVLRPGGRLFSLDGCYREGQSWFNKWILDMDRGQFVRDQAGYDRLLSGVFDSIELTIRENYSRVPYTFVVGVARKT